MIPFILGLHGLPRSGKGTIAKHYEEKHGFMCIGFGDALYREVAAAFSVTVAELNSTEWKENPQDQLKLRYCHDAGFYNFQVIQNGLDPEEPRTARWVLQQWGTEYRRKQNNMYWVTIVAEALHKESSQQTPRNVVVHDIRSNDEAHLIVNLSLYGFSGDHFILEVMRPGTKRTGHSSDEPIERQFIDGRVPNTGTLEELGPRAEYIIEQSRKS